MRFSRNRLEIARWVCIALTLAVVITSWIWEIRGGWAVLWFGFFMLFGVPAAMLSLHLHPPKFIQDLDNR